MADKKITELNSLTTPVGEDLFAVVDLDASETKKTTYANLTSSLQQDIVNSVTSSLVNTSYGLNSQTGSSTAITDLNTETSILGPMTGSMTVPANGFRKGDMYEAKLGGTVSFGSGVDVKIKIKADSIILADSGEHRLYNPDNPNNWMMEMIFVIREIGGAGTAEILTQGKFMESSENADSEYIRGFSFKSINNTTFDTTISNTLDITFEWMDDDDANSIFSEYFNIFKRY